MRVLLFIFLCTAITIPLISGVVVNLDGLICTDPPCNQNDRNSSLMNENHVRAFINCIDSRNSDYVNTQCGTQTTDHVFFCSVKEDDRYCSELILLNYYTEIPSACNNRSHCTPECKAVLMERFGCCIHLNFSRHVSTFYYNIIITHRLLELQELCDIPISDSCQLALTPPSVPVTQHEFDCPVDHYQTDISYNLYCEIFPENIQQIVDMALAATCPPLLKAYGFSYYVYCDRRGEELCINYQINSTISTQFSHFRRQCSIEVTCSPECRKSLISLSENLGCCANTLLLRPEYNPSPIQLLLDHFYSCSKKTDIWSHCEVTSPGFCDNPLTLGGTSQTLSMGLEAYVIALIVVGTISLLALVLIVGAVGVIVVRRRRRSR